MKGIFDPDSPLMNGLGKITDCILLSLSFITACIPIVTIGVACGSLYRTVYLCFRKEYASPMKIFWNTYRENLKNGILVWLPIMVVYVFLIVDLIILKAFVMPGYPQMARFYGIVWMLVGVASVWAAYCSAYCIRFNGTVREVLSINFTLVLSHPLVTLEILLFQIVGVTLILTVPYFLIIVPAALCIGISYPMEKVFLKHIRPEDYDKFLNE